MLNVSLFNVYLVLVVSANDFKIKAFIDSVDSGKVFSLVIVSWQKTNDWYPTQGRLLSYRNNQYWENLVSMYIFEFKTPACLGQ